MAYSLTIDKKEAIVLMDELFSQTLEQGNALPICFDNKESVPDLSEEEHDKILEELLKKEVLGVDKEHHRFIPTKSLDDFLLPMIRCYCLIAYKRVTKENSGFCVTAYLSANNGLVAIVDDSGADLRFVRVQSFRQLLNLLSPFSSDVNIVSVSIRDAAKTSIMVSSHQSRNQIEVYEIEKVNIEDDGSENEYRKQTISSFEFKRQFKNRIKEVCHAVSY